MGTLLDLPLRFSVLEIQSLSELCLDASILSSVAALNSLLYIAVDHNHRYRHATWVLVRRSAVANTDKPLDTPAAAPRASYW